MTGIIILAAGASTRMGQPKQQFVYGQKTLLQHSIDAALNIPNAIVFVVLGANAPYIEVSLSGLPVNIIYNTDFETGMSSSIKAGINAVLAYKDVDNALLMLCDQPFVNGGLLKQLIGLKPERDNYIIACRYGSTIGVPALFSRLYFNELLLLSGQEGAKKVLMRYADKVILQEFEKGSVDIDTPEDWEGFQLIN